MKIIPVLVEFLAKRLTDGVTFETAKRIVTTLESEDLDGETKKRLAYSEIKDYGYKFAGFLLSAVLELALVWLRKSS